MLRQKQLCDGGLQPGAYCCLPFGQPSTQPGDIRLNFILTPIRAFPISYSSLPSIRWWWDFSLSCQLLPSMREPHLTTKRQRTDLQGFQLKLELGFVAGPSQAKSRIYSLGISFVIFKEMIWSSWHSPQPKFSPSIHTDVAISWLLDFTLRVCAM